MSNRDFFLDTSFAQALINPRDQYLKAAKNLYTAFKVAMSIWVTDVVLIEIANALSAIDRNGAIAFLDECNYATNITIVNLDIALYTNGLNLYRARLDKTWGL